MSYEAVTRGPSAASRSRARLAGLLVLVALLPLLALAWIAAAGVGKSETSKADLRLELEGRAAAAVFARAVAEASSRAGSLAASAAVQQAITSGDGEALRRLIGPHDVITAGGKVLAGTPVSPAVRRRVSVTMLGRAVGSVTVNVPLDEALLERLRTEVRMDPDDRLALVRGNHAIAGPLAQAAAVPPGRAVDRRYGAVEYRVFGDRLVGPPNSVELLALTRRADISEGARDRLFWTVLAILVTLVTVAAVGYALAPLLARRGGPLAVLGGRRDGRAISLVGDALASTHNPDKLLPVVLHATMEATGAVRGRITQNGRVAAEEGERARAGRPLRIELASQEGADEVAVELWPESGAFDERTRALATTLAGQAAIALENARLHGIVQRQAITDELTELANRRYFMQTLDTELRRAERFDEPLALLFADLDDFKRVNDRYGHHVGDEVLRAFAGVIRNRVRVIDLAARLGGEEFAVLLLETDLKGAEALAESLRAAVEALEVPVVGGAAVRVTASFGIAVYPQTHNVDELMTAADLALYRAKREGKNRVSVHAGESV